MRWQNGTGKIVYRDPKMRKRILHLISAAFFLAGVIVLSRIFEPFFLEWATERIGRPPTERSLSILKWIGWSGIFMAFALQCYLRLIHPQQSRLAAAINRTSKRLDEWLENTLGRFVDFTMRTCTIPISAFNFQDAIVIFLIALFSIAWYLQRIQTDYPYVIFGSDLANIASFAIGLDHPELFKGDFLLSDVKNFEIYFQGHVLLSRVLGSWVNNYGAGILLIQLPTTFLYLSGFYWLGRTVINNRYWASVFTVVNLFPLHFAFENWGVHMDPTPRTGIQALLPFLLILVWKWRDTPSLKRWGLIAAGTGGLIYVHAVGAPVWMVGILLGLWTQMPKEWGYKKQVLVLAGLALLMILTQSFFIANYFKYRVSGNVTNYRETIELLRFLLPPEILDVPLTLRKTFYLLWNMGLIPFGILGTILLAILNRYNRRDLMLVLAWLVSVLVVAALLPLMERTVESYLRVLPIETDLIRGLRYLVPLLSLLGLWGMGVLSMRLKPAPAKWFIVVISLLLVVNVFNDRLEREFRFNALLDCIKTGRVLCLQKSDMQDILEVLKDRTESGSPVFFAVHPADTTALTVRYLAQRPLVYSWKDRGAGVANMELMERWFDIYKRLEKEGPTYSWFRRDPRGLIDFVQGLGTKYLILEGQVSMSDVDTLPVSIFYNNRTYTILELNP